MRTSIARFEIVRPRSVDEALRAMRDDVLLPIAGCTDVYVQLEFGQTPAQRYVDLWQLDELRGIRTRDGMLVMGALTTYTDIIRSSVVREWLPMLVAASRLVGGVQIQTRGTIGGNIANGSPAGDSLPVFAAADAVVVVRSVDAERRVPFTEFYTGYRASVMQPDELIVAVEVPRVTERQWFRKVGTRAAQAISKLVMAGVRAPAPRIALGSVAPTVVRLPRTEAALARGSLAEAQQLLPQEIAPIDDLRSTADYRRRVAANLLARFWHDTTP
ncbi:MAG: FAD binding domain-containing protein [Gemmatimonadota bacterium]